MGLRRVAVSVLKAVMLGAVLAALAADVPRWAAQGLHHAAAASEHVGRGTP